MATNRISSLAGIALSFLSMIGTGVSYASKAHAIIAQINHVSDLITVVEKAAKKEAKQYQACNEYTWSGSKYPGLIFDSITLHDNCYIDIQINGTGRYDALSGIQLILQPKNTSGDAWIGDKALVTTKPSSKETTTPDAEKNHIILFTCFIIPSEKQHRQPKMKPTMENYFALSASILNKCRFMDDTITQS